MRNLMGFKKKINKYLLFLVLIILGIYQYGIGKICGFTMVPDEFGYWASAAKNVGYDWSEVASLGSYYSFGYSFILTPVLWLFRDGVWAYKAALTINMLLMCVSMFLITGIIRRLFPEIDRTKQVFISGIAVLYPVWIFHMQMTMTEALLMFLFVLITYLFVCLCFFSRTFVTESGMGASIMTAVLLAASLAYIYSVHMRSVGILLACVITLAVWGISRKPGRKVLLAFGGMLLLLAVCMAVLKQNTVAEVFSNADSQMLAGNDYGGQRGKFRQIFNVQGMMLLLQEVIGKIFYLGLASFGFFYWGLGWAFKKSISLFGKLIKKVEAEVTEWFSVFLLLAMLGEILISSIYMHPAGTIDALIYGRYDEFLIPVFLMVGIVAMGKSKRIFRGTLFIGICTGVMVSILLKLVEAREMTGLRGYMVAGISYLLKEDALNVRDFFMGTWVLGFGVMLLTAFLVWLSGKGKNLVWLLAGIIAIEIVAGLQISSHYTYRVNNSNFADLIIAEEIIDHAGADDQVVYLDEGSYEYIDFLQMQLGERSIKVITEDEVNDFNTEKSDVFVIAHVDTEFKERLEGLFDQCVKSNTFYLYYKGKDTA